MTRSGLPILMYHSIDTSGSVISTDPTWFAESLCALAESGYRTVDLDDWITNGRPEIARGFAITFDDGLRSIARTAGVLSRLGFTATVFLVSDRMGSDNAWPGQPGGIPRMRLLSWAEVSELALLGFRFAAHTRTHAWLDRLDQAKLEEELRGSREAIEDRLGVDCRLFAYPYGCASRRARSEVTRFFSAAFGTRLRRASRNDDLYDLSRIDSYECREIETFTSLISGREPRRFRYRRPVRAARLALTRLGLSGH